MALERQTIEKKDFPIGRRGYDPEAVDAHLSRLAEEVEQLKVASRRRSETLASAASEQVRAIVEAAESSAAEIQRQAEEEAREIRAEAAEEAQTARQQANAQAREYVGKVSESTAVMLQRLDAMEGELSALIESLRTGANRLNADLQLLEGNLQEVQSAVRPRPHFESESSDGERLESTRFESAPEAPVASATAPDAPAGASAAAPPAPAPAAASGAAAAPTSRDEVDEDEPYEDDFDAGGELDEDDGAAAGAYDGEDEAEAARLIALNMALNGSTREETDRYLRENFELHNRAQLLDEVYSSLE